MTIYEEKGFINRQDYLESLAEEHPKHIVEALSDMLGESEDFDGLITALEDYSDWEDSI